MISKAYCAAAPGNASNRYGVELQAIAIGSPARWCSTLPRQAGALDMVPSRLRSDRRSLLAGVSWLGFRCQQRCRRGVLVLPAGIYSKLSGIEVDQVVVPKSGPTRGCVI